MLNNHRNIYEKMLFTDECRFCHTPDNRSMWIRSNDFREEKCVRYTKYTFGTMVWGALGKDYKSPLVFPRSKITAEIYREFVKESQFFADAESKIGKFNYIFQQDGAPDHTTDESYLYIENYAHIFYGWPANSPDLSPIEMVWAFMKNQLVQFDQQPTNQEELEEILKIIMKYS